MAAGDSQISIVNIGLLALGEDPISDINAPYKRAILMKGAYHRVRREVLEMRNWRCAKKLAQLSANPAAPAFGYANAFDLPSDFIRMFDDADEAKHDWEVMGSQVLTNAEGVLNVVYVWDLEDPTKMSPLLCKVIGLSLALDQCEAITQSDAKEAKIQRKLSEALATASTVSAQQASPREMDNDILLDSRN